MGTPSYMPPEQAGTRRHRPLADVYSLGAMLFCLLTGRPPFQAANVMDTLKQVLEQDPPPPHSLNAAIPLDLETIAVKCLRKEPHRRYASARELAEDLNRFLAGEPIRARQISASERYWRWARRNPVIAVLGGVLTAVLVLVTIGSLLVAAEYSNLAGAEPTARLKSERMAEAESARAEAERHTRQNPRRGSAPESARRPRPDLHRHPKRSACDASCPRGGMAVARDRTDCRTVRLGSPSLRREELRSDAPSVAWPNSMFASSRLSAHATWVPGE